jgi:hypothetical protein
LLKYQKIDFKDPKWICYTYNHKSGEKFTPRIDVLKDFDNAIKNYAVIVETSFASKGYYKKSKIFDSLLDRYIGVGNLIPFDISERKRRFPKAFDELYNYMLKWKAHSKMDKFQNQPPKWSKFVNLFTGASMQPSFCSAAYLCQGSNYQSRHKYASNEEH